MADLVNHRGGHYKLWAEGSCSRRYPRHTEQLLLLDPTCYDGPSTDRVLAPAPLGRMGRRLQELYEMPVAQRPIDLYAALVGAAR